MSLLRIIKQGDFDILLLNNIFIKMVTLYNANPLHRDGSI